MAEQFKKIYISPREFISSWEKEIYELNHLDYFIYQMINELAALIERSFFKKYDPEDSLYLHSEEIGTLSFNIGDSLQQFLDKNCFASCALDCPNKFKDKLNPTEKNLRMNARPNAVQISGQCQTKEDCLYSDILNYVVLDSVIDFYNYDLGIILPESDERIISLAEYCMDIVLDFIKYKGSNFLGSPQESASHYFEDLLSSDESNWQDYTPDGIEEDFDTDETETWKLPTKEIRNIFDEVLDTYDPVNKKYLNKFKEYLTDFLDLSQFEDLTVEDISEFFYVVLMNELVHNSDVHFDKILTQFENLFHYLEINHDVPLQKVFNTFLADNQKDLTRQIDIVRRYQDENSYLEYLIASSGNEKSIVEGFFKIISREDDYFTLEDIHLKTHFSPVKLTDMAFELLQPGDILHTQLEPDLEGWKLYHFEMIYPDQAKVFLY